MPLKDDIRALIKGDVADDDAALASRSRDASIFEVRPSLVVFPKDAADVKAVVRYAAAHPGVAITPRSAGTDMTGGTLGESIIMDFTRYFTRIREVGDGYAVTEPGVYYRDFEKVTLAKGWLLPSYPASREICTVGGMAANSSGGEKSLRYGKTENFVETLRVVLADGNEYMLGALDRAQLDEKMAQRNFEGDIYRRMDDLITKNFAAITEAKPTVSKNSAGYALWNVWDGKTFNLAKLFVGSQGTLGIITEIRYRLVRPAAHSKLLVIFMRELAHLPALVAAVRAHDPESFESYDDYTLKFALRYFRDIMKYMGNRNALALAWQFLPEIRMVLTGGLPKLVLLAEFTGATEAEVDRKIASAASDIAKLGVQFRITKTETEAKKYWVVRRESFNLLRRHFKKKAAAPFIDDFCVRPEVLDEFLPKLYAILKPYGLMFSLVGHMGDGNFHIIPLMDLGDPATARIIPELSKKVYDLVFAYGGSMTGEHNDGLVRGPYLAQMFGADVFALFKEVKRIFDPNDIFNPHKKTDADLGWSLAHLRKQ